MRLWGGEVRGCATLIGASEITSKTIGWEVRGCVTLMGASEVPLETMEWVGERVCD